MQAQCKASVTFRFARSFLPLPCNLLIFMYYVCFSYSVRFTHFVYPPLSGTAAYVLSALAYAKTVGAYTVMIQERDLADLPYCDCNIALKTGSEIIAGSTRMKAGTATKKILNFMSTSLMIRLGRVHGTFMTEMECLNNKLVKRAVRILTSLYNISADEALKLLNRFDLQLNKVVNFLESKESFFNK